ncbi:MAG: serine hydrolase domain-containing protein, partial [Myxococcota bacterium]
LPFHLVGEPGGDVAYSNTNYLILGLIIEELDGVQWEESVRARILTPLALDATAFAGEDGALDGVRAGELAEFEGEGFVMDPSVTWAAGGLVSNAIDIDRFGRALFVDKELVDAGTLSNMTNGAPYSAWPFHTATYGFGTLIVETTLGRTAVGHMGGVPGFTSRLVVDRDAGVAATVIVNRDGVTSWPICEKALDAAPVN